MPYGTVLLQQRFTVHRFGSASTGVAAWLVGAFRWTVHYPMCPVPPPHRRIFFAASASPSFAAACQRLTDRYLLTNGFRAQARKGKGESSDQRWWTENTISNKKKTHEKAASSLRTSSLMGNYSFRDYTNKFGRPFHTLHSAVDHSRIYPLDRLDLTRINWKWYIFVQILFMSYWSTSISNQWASIATQSGRHPLRPLPTRPFRTTILSGSGTSKYIM